MRSWLVWCWGWKLGLLGAAARRQGDSRIVCSDGGAVWAGVVRVGASIIACSLAIGRGRPATTSGVAILEACSRSGHVADAQVGEIRGYARLPPPPGWRKCPPLVIVSASAEVGRTLRCAYGVSLNRVSVRELSGRIAHIQPSLSALHPSVLACIDACASESSV